MTVADATGASGRVAGGLAVVFLDGDYGEADYYRAWAAIADVVVAADGGAGRLLALGVTPEVVVGDFDSLAIADQERLAAIGVEFVRHPVRKDQTDGELAVAESRRRGAEEVVLAGGFGALDHTLGHLALLLRLAEEGVGARLVAPRLAGTVLLAASHRRARRACETARAGETGRGAAAVLDAPSGTRVSLVPLAGDAVVSLLGLDYPLDHETLPADACLGLGNAVAATGSARVIVHEGAVAALVAWGAETFGGRPAPASLGRLR